MLAQLALLEWSAVVVGGRGRVPSRRALDLVGHGGVERGLVAPRLVEEVRDHGLRGVVRNQRTVREDGAGLVGGRFRASSHKLTTSPVCQVLSLCHSPLEPCGIAPELLLPWFAASMAATPARYPGKPVL